jgi:hypothetical protein
MSAAVEAMLEKKHNLAGNQTTLSGVEPLFIVSGSIVEKLGINETQGPSLEAGLPWSHAGTEEFSLSCVPLN